MITKALNRKEAIMMGDTSVTPMTREEAILAGTDGLKVFTRDEELRLAMNTPVDDSESDLDNDHIITPVNPTTL